jgi:hypothetical protein
VVPKYAQLKVPNTSPASHNTAKKIQVIPIKDEIKFLYKKKEQLNLELYRLQTNGDTFGIPSTIPSRLN